jgi:hypothetical protein
MGILGQGSRGRRRELQGHLGEPKEAIRENLARLALLGGLTRMTDANLPAPLPSGGQLLIYRDGSLDFQVRLDGQTVWLTQAGMAELFQTSVPNVSIHIRNILEDKELEQSATIKDCLIVHIEGGRSVRRSVTTST